MRLLFDEQLSEELVTALQRNAGAWESAGHDTEDNATMRRQRLAIAAIQMLFVASALCTTLSGAQADRIASEASSHLTDVIAVLRREWLYREKMDWDGFRRRVFQEAGAAQTIPETYDAIRLALRLLGDKHTYYILSSGETIFNPQSPTQSTSECAPVPLPPPNLPAGIGYVRIQITPATPKSEIQEALRRGDGPNVAIAFRGRPHTRSFGSATCGLSTAVRQFPLANRARLAVVVSVMADRHGRRYGGVVEPDEVVVDPQQVVERAVTWLRQR